MRLQVFLSTACALVYFVRAGSSNVANTGEICVTPNNERSANCSRITLMYFYNETIKMCQHIRWTGCDRKGVFKTRHECVTNCSKDQGAPFCATSPPSPCEETETRRSRVRFYYNITAQKCQPYNFCGEKQNLLNNNYFVAKGYCLKQCGGFDESTAKTNIALKAVE
uniref:BPTI/Kunitz inhibitor domain-containing protein n=1 Tax=Amblyomma maculatum TaxID=34609 RepID=G3MTQ7_AMBMU